MSVSVPWDSGTDDPQQLYVLHAQSLSDNRFINMDEDDELRVFVCVLPAEIPQNEASPLGSVELGVKSKACSRAPLWREQCYPPMDWQRGRMTWLVRLFHL